MNHQSVPSKENKSKTKTSNFMVPLESQLQQVVGSHRHLRNRQSSVNYERMSNEGHQPHQSSQRLKKRNKSQKTVINVTRKSYSLDPQTIDLSQVKRRNLPNLDLGLKEQRARSKSRNGRIRREQIQRPKSKQRARFEGFRGDFGQIRSNQLDETNQQSSQRQILELVMSKDLNQEIDEGGQLRNKFAQEFAPSPPSAKKNLKIRAENLDSHTFFQLLQGPKTHQDLRTSNFKVDLSNVDIEDLKEHLDDNFVKFKTTKVDYMLKNASLHTRVGALRKFMLDTLNCHQNLLKVSLILLHLVEPLISSPHPSKIYLTS